MISNDGWEHAGSDLCTIHDYEDAPSLLTRYQSLASATAPRQTGPALFALGHQYRGEPIIVSEMAGVALRVGAGSGWGYKTAADAADFLRRYEAMITALLESPVVQGFCVTQLTDVEQEINGLLTFDRQPKVDPERIRAITLGDRPTIRVAG